MLGLGLSLLTGGALRPYYAVVAAAFKDRVEADGGTVESMSCLKADLKVLNPIKPPAFTGLLNDYSGAAAAYSLRLLDNTYSGSAVRVRRSSDNAEQDIAFVNNELDTASLETFAGAGDAFVTTWYDQSGNGVDAINPNASGQPQIVDAGSTLTINGKPALYASSASEWLYGATTFVGGDILAANFTICSPSLLSIQSTYSAISPSAYTNGNRETLQLAFESSTATASRYEGGNVVYNASIVSGSQYLQTTNRTALNTEFDQRINGVDLSIASSSPSQNLNIETDSAFTMFRGGANNYDQAGTAVIQGYLQESIWYLANKSADINGIETNINDFYSIY